MVMRESGFECRDYLKDKTRWYCQCRTRTTQREEWVPRHDSCREGAGLTGPPAGTPPPSTDLIHHFILIATISTSFLALELFGNTTITSLGTTLPLYSVSYGIRPAWRRSTTSSSSKHPRRNRYKARRCHRLLRHLPRKHYRSLRGCSLSTPEL
jgi:hypothetical protein